MANAPKTALVLLFDGVEEIEVITPIDLLRRAGVEVTVASLGPTTRVTGRSNIVIEADTTLAMVRQRAYDALVIPGGPGVKTLRASPLVVTLAEEQAAASRLVAAICAAPTVLKDAGVLLGRQHTGHTSVEKELPEMVKDRPVVRDGNVITSRGAGTALPFGLALVEALAGAETAQKVAAAICHPH